MDPGPEEEGLQGVADPAHALHPQAEEGEEEVEGALVQPEVQDQAGEEEGEEEAQDPRLGLEGPPEPQAQASQGEEGG